MVKLSKIHITFLVALGIMIFGQVGIALYQGHHPFTKGSRRSMASGGGAKTYGFAAPQERNFSCASVKELNTVFNRWGFDLTKAKQEGKVPRLYLAKLPKDMKRNARTANSTFIRVLLPHLLKVNEQILADRTRLVEMHNRQKAGGHLHQAEKMWIRKLASDYRCKSTKIDSLLVHVDVVPPSLALSQAMIEMGGGISLAATHKNSTFGHMETKTKVAKFESLLENVKAYMTNLNRHVAYKPFRTIRAEMRKKNQKLCGHKLAAGLEKYSVRKAAYIKDVQNVIRKHKLDHYDHMTLEQHLRVKP